MVIAVVIKDTLLHRIEVHDSDFYLKIYGVLCTISRELLGTDENLSLCTIYIPPVTSNSYNDDIFQKFYQLQPEEQ